MFHHRQPGKEQSVALPGQSSVEIRSGMKTTGEEPYSCTKSSQGHNRETSVVHRERRPPGGEEKPEPQGDGASGVAITFASKRTC